MRQGAALSDAERVAVPVEEKYVACAAWGEASSWDKRAASREFADFVELRWADELPGGGFHLVVKDAEKPEPGGSAGEGCSR